MIGFKSLRIYKIIFSQTGIIKGSNFAFKKAFAKLTPATSKWKELSILFKKIGKPIHIRAGTSDWNVLNQIFVRNEYSEGSQPHAHELKLAYEAIVKSGKIPAIVDCGANIGLASLWYHQKYPESVIISIEPEPDNYSLMVRNTRGFPQIVPVNAAIANRRLKVDLKNKSDAPWAWETVESESGAIKAITINDALSMVEDVVPFIAKIDIEGFETELFESDFNWASLFPLIVFEFHDSIFPWKGTGHAFYNALTKTGCRDYIQSGENVFSYSHELLNPQRKLNI